MPPNLFVKMALIGGRARFLRSRALPQLTLRPAGGQPFIWTDARPVS
jgi:hypothetical protein